MTVAQLRKLISSTKPFSKMIWVDNNSTLLNHYIDEVSLRYNKFPKKVFDPNYFIEVIPFDGEKNNTLYLCYFDKKTIKSILNYIEEGLMVIFITEEELDFKDLEQVVFGKLSKNACIVFIEKYVEIPQKKKDIEEGKEPEHHISRNLIEEMVDYFDSDLDMCMNEVKKVEILELNSSWDIPFKALLEALPPKNKKLRSLSWFSGGDIDTCQVIYNLYVKKLRTLTEAQLQEQETWARLIKESVWCEACMVAGLLGDYVVDYLRLVESSLPGDFKIQYFPPVFYEDLKDYPEWIPMEE